MYLCIKSPWKLQQGQINYGWKFNFTCTCMNLRSKNNFTLKAVKMKSFCIGFNNYTDLWMAYLFIVYFPEQAKYFMPFVLLPLFAANVKSV